LCWVSFALGPSLWFAWFDALRVMAALPQGNYPPLILRLPIALIVRFVAATTNRRWLVPVACWLAVPNPWFVTLAVLGASLALVGRNDRTAPQLAATTSEG
jgi:hypothetical protein